MSKSAIIRLFTGAALALTIVLVVALVPVRDYLAVMLEWIRGIGPWGPVVLAAVYVAATVLFVPGAILTLGAGFLFGVVQGTITVSIGSVIGATLAFIIGRTLLRGAIANRLHSYPRFAAIDRAIGDEGFKIIVLLRLSPIFPFNLLNYAFGLTNVKLWKYALASWIGMLPGTVMYVYLGSALKSLAAVAAGGPQGSTLQNVFFVIGLLVTVVVTVVITRIARRALNNAVAEHQTKEEAAAVAAKEEGREPRPVAEAN